VTEGLHRFYGAGHAHFITTSCYRREPLLGAPESRDLFLTILEDMRRRYRFVVVGYVVMPEHVHLLLSEPERKTLSEVVQALKLGFVRKAFFGRPGSPAPSHVSQKRRDMGHPVLDRPVGRFHSGVRFWQSRFYDFNVFTERKRVEKLRYIHRNPVIRGLVTRPEEWKWSSFRDYAWGQTGVVRVNDWSILKKIKFSPK
jgi:putative transposase